MVCKKKECHQSMLCRYQKQTRVVVVVVEVELSSGIGISVCLQTQQAQHPCRCQPKCDLVHWPKLLYLSKLQQHHTFMITSHASRGAALVGSKGQPHQPRASFLRGIIVDYWYSCFASHAKCPRTLLNLGRSASEFMLLLVSSYSIC